MKRMDKNINRNLEKDRVDMSSIGRSDIQNVVHIDAGLGMDI
jgi:hypothetical protein